MATRINHCGKTEFILDVQSKKMYQKRAPLFPKTAAKFSELANSQKTDVDLAMDLALNSLQLPRSAEWLENNGCCLDNIVPRESTISQAGQGAFARRFLGKGTMIVPVPLLLTIPDKETLNLYTIEDNGLEEEEGMGDPIGKQLVMNYCFGHNESSLLLCPSSNANLINHCSHRVTPIGQCNEDGPNAKIIWASGWDKDTSDWLKKSLDDIEEDVNHGKRGLSFEIIATRDIKHDEEVSNIDQHHCIPVFCGESGILLGSLELY